MISTHPLALLAWCRRSARQREELEHRLLELIEDVGELRLDGMGLASDAERPHA
jgi:hypothetical protein